MSKRLTFSAIAAAASIVFAAVAPMGNAFADPGPKRPSNSNATAVVMASIYDGQSPYYNNCASSAYTARSAYLKDPSGNVVGIVELRYSPTCRTVWARVTDYLSNNGYIPGVQGTVDAYVHRNSDGRQESCTSTQVGQTSCYTPMLDDAGVTSYAHGDVDISAAWPQATTGSF